MEEVNRIGGEAERNQLKRRTELIGKPSLVVYHRKNVLSFEEIKHFFVGCNLNSPPYKPNIPLIHSILSCKLFVYICKFLYLYIIILADIYA